jgi:hypothetical protein
VTAAYRRLERADAATMLDFDDRDLVRFAETAGFERIHLECHIDVEPGSLARTIEIDTLLGSSPRVSASSRKSRSRRALARESPAINRYLV